MSEEQPTTATAADIEAAEAAAKADENTDGESGLGQAGAQPTTDAGSDAGDGGPDSGLDPETSPADEVAEEAPAPVLGSANLTTFVCHKTVQAFKIHQQVALANGNVKLIDETGELEVVVDGAYVDKHKPQAGGYFVQYHDGYRSWSPAEAFEDGYTAVYETPESDDDES